MRYLGIAFLLSLALTVGKAPAPQAITCATGRVTWLSGSGTPRMPLLIHFAGRPVGGGSVNRAGHWSLPLMVGQERPGLYLVEVRSRNDRALIGAFQCTVGVVLAPSAAPAQPTSTPAPATPEIVSVAPQGLDCPASYPIKGNDATGENAGERIYHRPSDPNYGQTKPERCFVDVSAAEAAGYRPIEN